MLVLALRFAFYLDTNGFLSRFHFVLFGLGGGANRDSCCRDFHFDISSETTNILYNDWAQHAMFWSDNVLTKTALHDIDRKNNKRNWKFSHSKHFSKCCFVCGVNLVDSTFQTVVYICNQNGKKAKKCLLQWKFQYDAKSSLVWRDHQIVTFLFVLFVSFKQMCKR